jgi:hypothetical protein
MIGKQGNVMAQRVVRLWYDPEGDYLEVIFEKKEGYFRETENDQVMEKVDLEGNILGFSILKVSSLKAKPLEVALTLSGGRRRNFPGKIRCWNEKSSPT